MKRFLDILRTPKPTSAELRKALAQVDVPAAQAEHERLKAERAALLMEGDDKTLDALEAKIAAAGRQVERAVIVRDQLTEAVASAQAREARDALTAERAGVEAEAAATAKALKAQYPKIATEFVTLLERLIAAEKAVVVMNAKLLDAGRGDELLHEVETRAFPVSAELYAPRYSLLARTSLSSKPGLCPGFNEAPDTGGYVIQTPSAPPLEPQRAIVTSGQSVGGFVDLAR